MTLTIENIGLSLEIGDELLNTLVQVGKRHYPNEFGGFLIGHYSDDSMHLNITDSIFPKRFKASKCSFERSTKGIKNRLGDYYKETPQQFYVGEWHTHPDNSSIPSLTDISAVNTIVNNQDSRITSPVLLIIGYSKTQVDLGFYVFFNNKLYRYEK